MNSPAHAMQSFSLFVLLPILAIAVFTDIRQHRIPNLLIVITLGLAFLFQATVGGMEGIAAALGGMAIGLLFFLPFYVAGGMGAGDVKLMSGVGAFLGPSATVLASALTLVAGAVLGILIIIWRGALGTFVRRYRTMLRAFVGTGHVFYLPPTDRDVVAMQPFPYAAAIAVGTSLAILWSTGMDPPDTVLAFLWTR